MLYLDVAEDIKRATNLQPLDVNMRYATDACEILSNKGDFDILISYLNIAVPNGGNLIALPNEVDHVIKVNLDGNPTFSRDRLYEFTLNGPGSDSERVDFTWEDRSTVSTTALIPTNAYAPASAVFAQGASNVDNGKTVTVTGRDVSGNEYTNILIVDKNNPALSNTLFTEITRVSREATGAIVSLYSKWVLGAPGLGDTLLASYRPDETDPSYRQIRLSKSGVTARILFRRKVFKITSLTDFIPVKSKRALLLMVKALRKYETNDPTAEKDEEKAVQWAVEEQKSTNAFIQLAATSEVQTIRGLNINNRDSLIMADVLDDADRIFGKIGTPKLFDKTTEVIELLSNKGHWDGRVGYVDILTDQFKYVTLPRYVETVLALNICNQPAAFRNGWFEFHLNGPGGRFQPCGTWTELPGEFPTLRDVNYPQKLVAIPDLSSDIGVAIRGYGYYQGKRIMTADSTGKMVDGFPISVNMSGAGGAQDPFVDRIERITKANSNGFIKLLGFDRTRNIQTILGYYWPDETEPRYKRIRLGVKSARVRIKYRKRSLKITSLTDPLHIGSKTAVTTMMAAVKLMDDGKFQEAAIPEAQALKLLLEEQASSNPLDYPELEFELDCNENSNFVVA